MSIQGLNLNIRTLMAVTKYFKTRDIDPKKFLYDEDFKFLSTELQKNNITITKSIDAEIMDLADEIAYAAHDLEDAIGFGVITLGEIIHEFAISTEYYSALQTIKDISKKVQEDASKSNSLDSSEEYSIVLKKRVDIYNCPYAM